MITSPDLQVSGPVVTPEFEVDPPDAEQSRPFVGATWTVTALDVTVEPALSVTCSSKCHVPPVERAPVEVDGVPEVVHPTVKELPRLT
jgi:hypothetical protein